jgi:hypothetical protein
MTLEDEENDLQEIKMKKWRQKINNKEGQLLKDGHGSYSL